MAECSFCSQKVVKGAGVLFVRRDGKPFYYCSSKCRKNSIGLKREGRKKKWTKTFRVFRDSQKKTTKKK